VFSKHERGDEAEHAQCEPRIKYVHMQQMLRTNYRPDSGQLDPLRTYLGDELITTELRFATRSQPRSRGPASIPPDTFIEMHRFTRVGGSTHAK
jgi:hypothetical protein